MPNQNPANAQRSAEFDALRRQMQADGYTEHLRTISILKANLLALVLGLPFLALFLAGYRLRWGAWGSFSLGGTWLFLLLFLLCIPLHEALHGLGWAPFCRQGFQSIRFGVMRSSLTPYCHCKEPLRFGPYLFGALLPFLVLGVGLFVASLFVHSSLLLALAVWNTFAAGGDMTIALMLPRHRHAVLYDHPTDCGFVAFEK